MKLISAEQHTNLRLPEGTFERQILFVQRILFTRRILPSLYYLFIARKNRRMKNDTSDPVTITFRIPGNWAHPGEILKRMPAGYRLTPEALVLPDGQKVEFHPAPPDDQFVDVFQSACRTQLTEEEIQVVRSYTVNLVLNGSGGNLTQAWTMMAAASAIIQAGGAGVFIDNSALAHSGQAWMEMASSGDTDALSFAYVSVINGQPNIWTMGMHMLGFPDLEMDQDCGSGDEVLEIMRYVCASKKPIGDGHIIADENGPRFHIFAKQDQRSKPASPMFNPYGRLLLKSARRVAEEN